MDPSPDLSGALLMITRDGMGSGPPELQRRLVATFLGLLIENGWAPLAIAFYTDGVKLLVEGSPVLESLGALEKAGVRLIACKTCLDHHGLTGSVRVGIVGGMGDIMAAAALASKVITL